MGEFRNVSVQALEEPNDPDRQTSVMHEMDDLVADIKAHGLLNPICVEDLGDGRYRVFAGHRRSIAVTILQWKEVACHVFQKDDPAIERMKASENMKRTQLTESEEALVYRRVLERENKTAKEIALYFDRPFQRVQDLIDITYGDPRVFDLLGKGEISRAQAIEINRFETEVYRGLAIEQATKHGLKAMGLSRWRRQIAEDGGEQNVQTIMETLKNMAPVAIEEPHQICQFGNHAAPLRLTKMYVICSEHWDMIIQGLEALHREAAANGGA
jgi:ParB/RepB/Spo0J family partition protein